MEKIINWITVNIQNHGLSAVFVGSLLEEMIAPIPSPAVMMGAGAILLNKYTSFSAELVFELLKIALIGGLGALIGSYFIYGIGYFGGKPLVEKTRKFTGIKWSIIEKMQNKLENSKRDEVTILLLRSIPVMPAVVISITAGLLRINPLSYSFSFYFGGIIRNIIFLFIGWKVGDAYKNIGHTFDSVQNIVTLAIGLALVIGIGYLYLKRNKIEKELESK